MKTITINRKEYLAETFALKFYDYLIKEGVRVMEDCEIASRELEAFINQFSDLPTQQKDHD